MKSQKITGKASQCAICTPLVKFVEANKMNSERLDITKYDFPILQIETMSICNMECKFCVYPIRRDKGKVLPEETILNIIDSISLGDGFKYICFSHINEPLIDNRIYKFIKYAKEREFPVMILTNGLLLSSKDVTTQLIDSHPDYIKVGLQIPNPELFFRSRKVDCDFKKYKEGIIYFLKAAQSGSSKVTIDIACNCLSGIRRLNKLLGLECGDPSVYDTVHDLKADLKSFLKELHESIPSYKFNDSDIDNYLNRVRLYYPDQPGIKIAEKISVKIKPFTFGMKLEKFYPVKKAKACTNTVLGILASGCVVPCCEAYGDFLSLGNVQKEPLRIILERNVKLLNNIKRGVSLPLVCQRCLGAPTRRGTLLKQLKYAFR